MESARQITCRELVELITDYLEGALPASERKRFEAHIKLCPGCDVYLDQIRQTSETLGRLTEDRLDPQARDDLLRVFRDWKQRAHLVADVD